MNAFRNSSTKVKRCWRLAVEDVLKINFNLSPV
uniref:Uncharacterized protein n=1 Tax=Lepeophtheirus salmonis TaxID=72036 RepID=A0A0K2VEU8_LEPSM